ncbi:MAG: DMT family transporter [Bryobacterales bacterium]|nr:DMT family transporter [Bryobacterales bacterium]
MSAAISQAIPARENHWRIYLMVFGITLLWAGNFIAVKFAIAEMPPLLAMGFRTVAAGMLMVPVFVTTRRSVEERQWLRTDFWLLAVLGIGGVTLNQLFFTLAMDQTSVAHGSLIISTTPISILLLASLLKQERLTSRKIVGMLLALGGVALIQFTPEKAGGASWQGDLLAMCGSLTFAAFTVFGKQVTSRHKSVTINAFAYFGGALLLLPAVFWLAGGIDLSTLSTRAWLAIAYMAVFPSVICYVGYFHALNYVSASRVAVFAYLQPAMATLMAVPLLGETVSSSLVLGGCIALLGVAITQRG